VTLNNNELDNKPVPNFMNQSFCRNYNLNDGESYMISIIPVDIMNNTLKETITIHIDTSIPDINDMFPMRDGMRQLFIHNSTDLSKMAISFEALDEHSGLHSIEWTLGTTLGGKELGKGSLAVKRIQSGVSILEDIGSRVHNFHIFSSHFQSVYINIYSRNRAIKQIHVIAQKLGLVRSLHMM
jgi:hypothetical protein